MIKLIRSGSLSRLSALTAAEWRWLLAALVLLPTTGLCLRFLGYRRTRGMMDRFRSGGAAAIRTGDAGDPCPAARGVARMVSLAARYGPYRAPCLPEALVGWALLRRIGAPVLLRIGVALNQTRFSAHAWVELGGEVLIGGAGAPNRYQAMI
jgi:hypothetical protein